jgi:hypothetical protein
MVNRSCLKCNLVFNRKYSYDRHINKKFNCESIKEKKNENEQKICKNLQIFAEICKSEKKVQKETENITCSFCKNIYSTKYTLSRHIKNCKIKKNNDDEKKNIFNLLLEKENNNKINILEKQNKLLMDKIDKLLVEQDNTKSSKIINNNISNTINNNSNTQNNIVMVNFGKEDLSIIDEKLFIDRIIKKTTICGV